MLKPLLIIVLFCLVLPVKELAQTPTPFAIVNYVYHPPSQDKRSWQRLNLLLSTWYHKTSTAGIGSDSCLLYTSRLLGMSRLPVIADGIDDPELISQSEWFDERNPAKGAQLLSQLKGKKHLEQLILLGAYFAYQPGSYSKYKDSIEHYLKKAIDESKAIGEKRLGRVALCHLGKMYTFAPDPKTFKDIFDQLISECKTAGDKRTEAMAFLNRGMYTPLTPLHEKMTVADRLQERIDCFNTAAKIYRELNDTEGEIISLMNAGYFLMALSRFDETLTAFLKALELENAIGFPYTHYTKDNIAMIQLAQGKFGEPLRYALESVTTAEAVRDSIGWGAFYDRVAILYYTEGNRLEESLKWMYKAVDRAIKDNDADVYFTIYNIAAISAEKQERAREAMNLILSVSKKGPPADSLDRLYYHLAFSICHVGLKQYKLAERQVQSADSILKTAKHEDLNNSYARTSVYNTYASVYFAAGEFARSKKYIELDLNNSTRTAVLIGDIMAYKQLLHIDSVFNDAPSAVNHYKKYVQLLDSNFKASKIRQAEEFQAMYQTREKQDSIVLLNQQTQLEKANLKQATLVKNLTIAGIIGALIIAGLLYRQSRLRKKTNNLVTHKNEQLQHLLTEKEWLLKEIHHRVKNNLQIVMSLLNSQSAFIDNEPALTAIHDSQHRVHAMSLIHQKLYSTENVSSINMPLYIRELTSYLGDSFTTGQRVRFEFALEPLEMDVSQAVPLGLILNEAITNSIKYAFPDGRTGVIAISLSQTTGPLYLLTISDNGIGIPLNLDNKKPGSLGMSLMGGLSEDLGGTFSIENNYGTTVKVTFALTPAVMQSGTLAGSFVSNN